MVLKKIKPTTSSQRNLIVKINKNISKTSYLKQKIKGLKTSSGRNNLGKITSYHKGGGHKKKYRNINFLKQHNSIEIVISIEYDPNRTANIAAVFDLLTNKYSYRIAPKNLTIGDIIKSGTDAEIKIGHSLPISNIPVGSYIHNISLKKNKISKISRSAGTFSRLIEKNPDYCKLLLNSGDYKFVNPDCMATIGIVSNEFSFLTTLGKAGRSRWLNKRPIVRGVAMNPIDHPHGGGEGKTSGGRSSVTPWGKPTKSQKKPKKFIIIDD